MKLIFTILAFFVCLSSHAQHYWTKSDGELMFERVYTSHADSSNFREWVYKSFEDVQRIDHNVYSVKFNDKSVDLRLLYAEFENIPNTLWNTSSGEAKLEWKPNRYKVTAFNIYSLDGNRKEYWTWYYLKKGKTRKSTLAIRSRDAHSKLLSKIFEFNLNTTPDW